MNHVNKEFRNNNKECVKNNIKTGVLHSNLFYIFYNFIINSKSNMQQKALLKRKQKIIKAMLF